ncbi:FadR/GntR family transcriptional regulator [Actinocorallia sp. A-T 12471]|uniref:FadR/GntR family transcriptional regulator n=1 Tax=Actinocorallia sp. A-T 12471 TaxID=3089813 RepID=UPI0029CDD0B1|nr:FCD domain-containing protein [Actinocorallia sp. A-T 12471]MDX6741468.1 FCD domain-containing protein [Actinocorallia sp. A-T 12471]
MENEVPGESTGDGPRRGQFRPPRLAEVVASVLRERIIDGEIPNGGLLPKQDDLLEEFRISRPSLREALRILENEGLLTVRRGNVGGSVVEVPTADTSAYLLGIVLQSRRGTVADLAVAIKHIVPITASLCAERADRETAVLPALRANLEQAEAALDDGVAFTRISRAFHESVVASCGNETMILTLGALMSLWSEQERQWAQRARVEDTYPNEEARAGILTAHRALVKAITEGDADRAAHVARSHLEHARNYAVKEAGMTVVRATSLRSGLHQVGG